MEDYPEQIIPILNGENCWFIVPPRGVWKKFCEEMDFEGKYIPEPDDILMIFRKMR